jgi:hypothetical protein
MRRLSIVYITILVLLSVITVMQSSIVDSFDPTVIHPVQFPDEYINREVIAEEIKPFSYYMTPNNGTRNTL